MLDATPATGNTPSVAGAILHREPTLEMPRKYQSTCLLTAVGYRESALPHSYDRSCWTLWVDVVEKDTKALVRDYEHFRAEA